MKTKRDSIVYLFIILSAPGYIWCGLTHFCMCGHLAHGPHSPIVIAIELIWISLMATAAVLSIKSTIKKKKFFTSSLFFLLISRFLLLSLGGFLFLIEFPLLILLWIRSIIAFFGIKNKKYKLAVTIIWPLLVVLILFFMFYFFY